MEPGRDSSRPTTLQALRWIIAVVLLAVGTTLLATAAYAAYVAKLWTAAARGEPAWPSGPAT